MVPAIPQAATSTRKPPPDPQDKPLPSNNERRRPTLKNVPSRYLSPSPSHSHSHSTSSITSSKRYPSPLLSRATPPASNRINAPSSLPNRSQSVDRRRPSQTPVAEMSVAAKMLITSTRSLSVSFQGEVFSLPISKKKEITTTTTTPVSHRKPTPERRRSPQVRDQRENSKPVDHQQQQLWPGASTRGSSKSAVSSHSLIDESSRVVRLGLDLGEGDESTRRVTRPISHSRLGSKRGERRSSQRNVIASAKFWQETNTRLRRLQDPGGSPRCSSPSSRISSISSKLSQSKRFSGDTPLVSSPRGMASPMRGGATRPASPISEQMNAYNRNLPSILCFTADIRRGKIGEDRVVDAHLLRLLYNRHLQWRFANARADSTFMVQRLSAEKNLWNAWVSISDLRHSVTLKRIRLLLLKQKLKLASILKEQMGYLEEWSLLDRDHLNSLLGATEALKASTLRLPIIGKAVDILHLKHAVSSAVDVMHAMASSIFSLTSKVDGMNSVMAEMVNITAQETVLLEQCQGFLSIVAAMQVKDCSLKTHIIQLSRKLTSQLHFQPDQR
ncbi:BnaA01g26040D [Brassica napus]|uniref:BnaA01g26040D protein n=1 Tax=Brassica napus TaxID=3708 RepID=A0A078HWR6_BRANA|nr:BnaA01g26040D [Brassica napus]